jgi:hypothetical protein
VYRVLERDVLGVRGGKQAGARGEEASRRKGIDVQGRSARKGRDGINPSSTHLWVLCAHALGKGYLESVHHKLLRFMAS